MGCLLCGVVSLDDKLAEHLLDDHAGRRVVVRNARVGEDVPEELDVRDRGWLRLRDVLGNVRDHGLLANDGLEVDVGLPPHELKSTLISLKF